MTRPIPRVYTSRFFQLITTRQFAEAERILERVKQKMHPSERNRGYFQALYGMLLTQKNNNDRYAFLSSVDLTDKKLLKHFRQEFSGHVESRLHADYDRGFFEAWTDYMKILPKFEVAATPPANNKITAETPTDETQETPLTDEIMETSNQPNPLEIEEKIDVKPVAEEKVEVASAKPQGQSKLVDFEK